MNGIVTVISVNNLKILNSEPMSRRCMACAVKIIENKNDPLAFKLWRESHECKINSEDSAPRVIISS